MKQFIPSLLVLFYVGSLWGQEPISSVVGKVEDFYTGIPLSGVDVMIKDHEFITAKTDEEGRFVLSDEHIPLGEQVLVVEKTGFLTRQFHIKVEGESPVEVGTIRLEEDISDIQVQAGTIALGDDELDGDDSGADNISGLLQSSRDVFLRAAAFDFSSTFFRPRGLDSEYSKALINGLEMNKMFNGRPLWANWGGLNDVQRNQELTMGLAPSDYNFGGPAGSVQINMRASQMRKGGRVSYAAANRTYTGRVMGSYSSGMTAKGWAYSVLMSRRFGNEGYIEGTPYEANAFFVAAERKFSDNNSLNLTAFYTPNTRGRSSANTQEMVDIKGVRYNAFWGEQDGHIRNSRLRRVAEPVFMLNHYLKVGKDKQMLVNTNIGYQFGETGNSRIGQDGAPNADPSYYRYMPSFALADANGPDYENAYHSLVHFQEGGQIDWERLYATNIAYDGHARYYLFEDRTDDRRLMANAAVSSVAGRHVRINGALNYRNLKSENFANMIDLLGATGYLDIDVFSEGIQQQPDLQHPDRVVGEGERFRYNYELEAEHYDAFVQAQFLYRKIDFYLGATASRTSYQRNGLYQNGSFPDNSLGKSEAVDFTDYGAKGGFTYKFTGRHLFDVNAAWFTKAPHLRNSFSNARQNNEVVIGLQSETIQNIDAGYIFRFPYVKGRLTGYYVQIADATELSFFYADGLTGISPSSTNAFVQEVLTGVGKRHMGLEFGMEAQVLPSLKLKAAATAGEYAYDTNPNLYLTSDDFDHVLDYGESHLKNYHLPDGPQQAYQIGFEYRDPRYWWVGVTANYFSHAYINISPLTRTRNFYTDADGLPFNDYDEDLARHLLRQERFDDYMLFNVVGGKSWRVKKKYYVGFFAVVNNMLGQEYKTGGFEQSRNADYRNLRDDMARDIPVFGPRYWFGYGTTYYVNFYIRY